MAAEGTSAGKTRPCSAATVGVLYEAGAHNRQREGIAMAEDDFLEEWNRRFEQWDANKRLRKAHPYVADLILVLRLHGSRGCLRQAVLRTLEKNRRDNGLRIPEKFVQSVQGEYNRHCVDSAVFAKRNAPESDGLFYSPAGKGSGIWAVNVERAAAWIEEKLKGAA